MKMTEEAAAAEVQSLIPGLPDEIAIECLIRVPYKFHSDMKSVCHSRQNLISSSSFYQERLKSGSAEHLVCQIQTLPSPSQSPPPTPTTANDSTQIIPDHSRMNSAKKDAEDQQQPQQQQIHSPPQYGLTIYNSTNQSWQRIRPKFGGIPMLLSVMILQPGIGQKNFNGLWPFANISPRCSTVTVTSTTCATGVQFQWLWFFSKEQQRFLQQQQNGEATAMAREYEDKEKRCKFVSSVVQLPNSITGISPCVSVTTLGHDLQRVFLMTGNGGRGSSSPSSSCNECEGKGAFMMERDNRSGNTRWNHVHVHMPAGFSGFPYSTSCLVI